MTNGKRQPDEDRQSQHSSPEPINLSEYAGDEEDNKLTCEQVSEYLEDLDRSQRVKERRVDDTSSDRSA